MISFPSSLDVNNESDHTHWAPGNEDILGHCYRRRTRVRQPIEPHPLKQREGGIYAIYSTLACPALVEPVEVYVTAFA